MVVHSGVLDGELVLLIDDILSLSLIQSAVDLDGTATSGAAPFSTGFTMVLLLCALIGGA